MKSTRDEQFFYDAGTDAEVRTYAQTLALIREKITSEAEYTSIVLLLKTKEGGSIISCGSPREQIALAELFLDRALASIKAELATQER